MYNGEIIGSKNFFVTLSVLQGGYKGSNMIFPIRKIFFEIKKIRILLL